MDRYPFRLAAGLLGLLLAGTASAETFSVNAQYRGVVKKAFQNIGTGDLNFVRGSGGSFSITGRARVDHPKEEGRVYDMTFDMRFKLQGNTITELSNNNRCNKGSEEALQTTEKILPFVHIIKNEALADSGTMSFSSPRGQFTLRLADAPRNLEATLNEGGRMVGKFFMPPDADAPPRALEKFRITTKTGTVLSFVSGSGSNVSRR